MDKQKYFLGAFENERRRLEAQAILWDPLTNRVLAAAGLADGMTVLDIGTGAGDVALLAAKFVGPSGRVLSIDINEEMVDHARQRAQVAGIHNVDFQLGSLDPKEPLGSFDLVTGRLVTAFQPDRISFVRHAASLVKPGGTLALLEAAWNVCGVWSNPVIPVYDQMMEHLIHLITTMGFDAGLGSRMSSIFRQAGLSTPSLMAELLTGSLPSGLPDYCMTSLEAVMLSARSRGVQTFDQVTFEAMCTEVRQTAEDQDVQFHGTCVIGAWATIDHILA